jgi:ribosomal protein S15
LTKEELAKGIERSKWLTTPLVEDDAVQQYTSSDNGENSLPKVEITAETTMNIRELIDGVGSKHQSDGTYEAVYGDNVITPEQRQRLAEIEHETAQEALQRIASLSLSSGKDRLRINTQRCIDVFGRHNTDSSLPPKPKGAVIPGASQLEKSPRVGPDTGSSEVQVAILTAKIRSLADLLETRGHTDKHGKRDLRLLVHRRAKLLKYLRKKERGGPRWQHLIETLGLTEGTWQGEITM